ncbi:hypothetical protein [Solimicrobium silvestre]|uniref:Uncharacterized protein n=1 Tax=Solimicrobium silvestre TaxID=2099400 RepID=A0A2S9H1P5_9BURK|nr:hypothetical protein [Solimicrobium silvestre]PRC93911.1 hypothetical protein S2091_1520 [Solimicrobium silvestre]
MSDAYRQSALLLHGINKVDRQWILAQLAEEQHVQLSTHLEELTQMGMLANRSLVEGLLSRAAGKSDAPATSTEQPGYALRSAHADVVLHLLNKEPTWLIAAVLSIEAWPWREAIYIGLDASKRDRVKHALRETLPKKLGLALITQLEERLPYAVLELQSRPVELTGFARFGQQISRKMRTWI